MCKVNYTHFRRAFSLCEVVIAMGVSTVALAAMLSLFPTALVSTRESIDLMTFTHLADTLADRMAREESVGLPSTASFYFDEAGRLLPSTSNSAYEGVVTLRGSSVSANLAQAKIRIQRVNQAQSARSFCYLLYTGGS